MAVDIWTRLCSYRQVSGGARCKEDLKVHKQEPVAR
jgi:hypothetical protein